MLLREKEVLTVLDRLESEYPEAECALIHENIFELIVAVTLSAQTTDVSVNKVTPRLFSEYPTPEKLASALQTDLEKILKTIGMYKNKSKNIKRMAEMLVENYDGKVPSEYDELIKLPGVGRKTANVVLSVGFGVPRIAVDTHVFRLANRIGLTAESNVLKTEMVLMERIPMKRWSQTHHSLIFHGRNCCRAANPGCNRCIIEDICRKNGI